MALTRDLREFIELLNSHEVEYLVVGAHALSYYGHPRFTGDLDLLVRRTRENAAALIEVLLAFGFESAKLSESDFLQELQVVQLGRAPNRIDLLTGMSGLAEDEPWKDPTVGTLDGISVRYISKEAFIKSKLAIGRAQDHADVDALRALDE